MILKSGESVVDLPAGQVGQIVIVHERSTAAVAPCLGGSPGWPAGKPKRCTTLMRISELEMRRITAQFEPPRSLRAVPIYWCPRGDCRVEVFPIPDQDYDMEAMAVGGRPLGDSRRGPAAVPTVMEFAAAMKRSWDDQQSKPVAPQRIERFRAPMSDEEE